MTLDQINHCLASSTSLVDYAKLVATLVRLEMLAVAQANTVFSNDAMELYKDLQAYDRFESGLNY